MKGEEGWDVEEERDVVITVGRTPGRVDVVGGAEMGDLVRCVTLG